MKGSKFHGFIFPHIVRQVWASRDTDDATVLIIPSRGFLSRGEKKSDANATTTLARRVNSTRDRCPDYYCCFFSSWAPIFPTLREASHAEEIFPPLPNLSFWFPKKQDWNVDSTDKLAW